MLKFSDLVLYASIALGSFALTYFVLPLHTIGDQQHYIAAYEVVAGKDFLGALLAYRTKIFSFEPIHFLVSWVFSSLGVPKVVLMGVFNSLLSVLFAIYLRSKGYSQSLVLLISITNYYMFALFFTLEKLKFSYIFLLFYLITRGRLFLLLSVAAHLQGLIPILLSVSASLAQRLSSMRIKFRLKKTHLTYVALAALIIPGSTYFMLDYGIAKVNYYLVNAETTIVTVSQSLLMLLLTVFNTEHRRIEVVSFFVFLALIILLIDGSRLNMLAFFAYLHFSNPKRSTFLASLIPLSMYMGYKSGYFILTIILDAV